MPRPKPTKEALKERESLAVEVKDFLKNNKFTEVKLADVLGVSRRTVQMMKAGNVTPHPTTFSRWTALKAKYKKTAKK